MRRRGGMLRSGSHLHASRLLHRPRGDGHDGYRGLLDRQLVNGTLARQEFSEFGERSCVGAISFADGQDLSGEFAGARRIVGP